MRRGGEERRGQRGDRGADSRDGLQVRKGRLELFVQPFDVLLALDVRRSHSRTLFPVERQLCGSVRVRLFVRPRRLSKTIRLGLTHCSVCVCVCV